MPQAKLKSDGQEPIAIVGMSCLFPMAPGLAPFFGNILAGRDCLREPNENEWDTINYQNPSGSDFKKIYCVRGGFVTELADFDPLKYGVMPRAVHGADPDQFLALRVAVEAMADAGYNNLPTALDKGEVILGRTSAPGQGAMTMIQQGQTVDQMLALVQKLHPEISHDDIRHLAELLHGSLAPTNSDTVPGVMPNLLAGRIAQRLGFKGRNLLLDAACASSLIAVETAVRDLRTGACDVALAGGIHINSFACFYQMFCALTALSPNQEIRPFDQAADGTILGEGIGAVVLKRYSEALENNDRIYAIIRGVGSSSDGHGTSLLAPSHEGESLAIQRAFEDAGVSTKSIGLIEAHGTGTPAGDAAELQAVKETYGADTTNSGWIALGSVKSMIGHTQAASGMAGLIKAALSLYHRVLPPTLNVVNENKSVDWAQHPCRISTQTRPWIHPKVHPSIEHTDQAQHAALKTTVEPRRAAVSAFGFGGVNAHIVLEEHEDKDESKRPALIKEWETELVVFSGNNIQELLAQIDRIVRLLDINVGRKERQDLTLRDIAFTLAKENTRSMRVAIVAKSLEDLLAKLLWVGERLSQNIDQAGQITEDIFFTGKPSISQGKLAYVLPGLGAAYPNMLKDLCMHFPDVRMAFDYIDQMSLTYSHEDKQTKPFSELHHILPSTKLFGIPKPGRPGPQVTAALLASMDSAVVTVLLAEWSLYQLLKNLGVEPSSIVGVSTGEFAALLINGAADVLETAPVFYRLSTGVANAVSIAELAKLRSIKVTGDWEVIEPILKKLPHTVYLGADLSPKQMLLSGTVDAIAAAKKAIEEAGFEVLPLPIAIPYHTPLVEGKVDARDEAVKAVTVSKPKITTWACSLIDKYPDDTEAIRKITTELFTRPIHFKKTIEAMYAEGTRIFVEVGPRGGMTPVIDEVLSGKEYVAIASNLQSESGITQLNRTLANLFCHAVPLQLDYLFERRANIIDLDPQAKPARSTSMHLSLKYPEISLSERPNLPSIQHDSVRAPDYFEGNRAENRPFNDANAGDLPFPQTDQTQQYDQAEPAEVHGHVQPLDEEDPFAVIDAVMDNYIKTLESFHTNIMAVQAQIFSQFFTTKEHHDPNLIEYDVHDVTPGPTAPAGFESTPPLMPGSYQRTSNMFSRLPAFMESSYIINCTPEEIEILLPLTLDSHRYLKDHAIGGAVRFSAGQSLNAAPGEDERVHLLPLTVAIEMMCEAASLVSAGQIVTAVENIRAMRRIRVGQEGVWLLIFAKREAKGTTAGLKVVRQDEWLSLAGGGEHYSGQHRLDTADMTAQIVLGKERPAKPSKNAAPPDGRPPTIAENQLYAEGNMFHGPRMQSVMRIESVGKREITGIITARTAADWFGQTLPYSTRTNPTFIADPLLLDNSTQLVLFHLYEHQENCTALLPFHVQSLTLYKPLGAIQGEVRVFARLRSISDRGTEADVEISTLDGQLIAEFESISSRRIALSDTLKQFVRTPAESLVAASIENLPLPADSSSETVVAFIKSSDIPDDETVATWLSDYFLTGVEQQYLSDSITRRERKREWLLGRIAAKDAMRRLYIKTFNRPLPPLELSILPNQNGAPFVQSHFLQSQGITTQISITHKDGYAIALARFAKGNTPSFGYGIDYEPYAVREEGLERLMLNDEETHFISGVSADERNQILTRIWAAKESSAKALGTGIGGNPVKWTVKSLAKEQDHYRATVLSPSHLTGNEHLLTVSIQDQFDGILAVASVGT